MYRTESKCNFQFRRFFMNQIKLNQYLSVRIFFICCLRKIFFRENLIFLMVKMKNAFSFLTFILIEKSKFDFLSKRYILVYFFKTMPMNNNFSFL